MRTLSRVGIAAAAALALTPAAWPCDPASYDPKDDAPRAQVCEPQAEQAGSDAAPDAQAAALSEGEAIRASLAGSGGGTGSGAEARSERHRGYIPTDDYPHEPAAW